MKQYVCGIDVGTSTLKISFIAKDGTSIGPFQREIDTIYPKPLYAEQSPELWLVLLQELFAEAFQSGRIEKHQILALLPDAATHTTVLLDENCLPIRNAILWNDQRSATLAQRCDIAEEIFRLTNHYPSAMWSLFQLQWVKENEPNVWNRIRHVLFTKDYIRFVLTGKLCTDHIDAQGSQLYNVQEKKWSSKICAWLGLPLDWLPIIKKPTDIAGSVSQSAAERFGLVEGTNVIVGTSDTALELLAAGAIDPGQCTIKLATSGRICVVADQVYPHKQLVNYDHVIEGLHYPGTGTRSCITSLRWFKQRFAKHVSIEATQKGKNEYDLLDEIAAKAPPGCDGLMFHPYLLGEFSPYSDENLRASFIGASMNQSESYFIRAVMEGVAYSLWDCMSLMQSFGIQRNANAIRLIGGGAKSSLWRQMIADVFQTQILVPATSESSFGGALLAGVVCGMFSDIHQAVAICCKDQYIIEPIPINSSVYSRFFPLFSEIVQTLKPIYSKMGDINRSCGE